MANIQPIEAQSILCPRCLLSGSWRYGMRGSTQEYLCRGCGRKFNNRGCPLGMRTPNDQLGAALSMFYEGISQAEISRELGRSYGNPVNPSSVHRWVKKYTKQAIESLADLQIRASKIWIVDETVVKINGQDVWLWDVIDYDSLLLLASHMSGVRTFADVEIAINRAWQKSDIAPKAIHSNGPVADPEKIARVFDIDCQHIQSHQLTTEISSTLIERFRASIRQRTRVMDNIKSGEMAVLVLGGFLIDYNLFRPRKTFKDKTPAVMVGLDTQFQSWLDIIMNAEKIANRNDVEPLPFNFRRQP